MALYVDDPNIINQATTNTLQSSAGPYKEPVGSHTGENPYTGEQENISNTATQQQYNQTWNPTYSSPNQAQTYTPLQDTPDQYQTLPTPLAQYDASAAQANAQGYAYNGPPLTAAQAQAAQGQTALAGAPAYAASLPAASYQATQGVAAQGTVDPMSMVQNQMTEVLNSGDYDGDGLPDWTQPAVTASNQRSNELGLGASTMAANAQSAAIFNAALPMATANAQVVAQLNSQNLSNSQQTMLSNAAWDNAAKQFNATTEEQNKQFFSTLTADVAKFNATQTNAMEQFNAGLTTDVSKFNATNQQAMTQFGASLASDIGKFNVGQANTIAQSNAAQENAMEQFLMTTNNQRDQFNSQNQILVDQSNVQWRRTINTADTAGINAANQANAANMFNMSSTAQNNVWQQSRDEASWALTAEENAANRELSLVNSSLNRATSLEIMTAQMNSQMYSSLGALGSNLATGLAPTVSKGLDSMFSTTAADEKAAQADYEDLVGLNQA